MSTLLLQEDTICAVATPQGMGGIAVARVSGPDAINVIGKCWRGARLEDMKSHTVHLGRVVNTQGELLDQVVLTLYRAPHSFTGEDVVEIACHGSVWIQQQILQTLIDAGCRMATGGEFTRRAMANGKLDLIQAEGVADVIASQSQASHLVAMNQMRGQYSRYLNDLRVKLLHFVSLIELELDFSEEDVTFAQRSEVIVLAEELKAAINKLISSFSTGNAIRNGLPVAIIGPTNAGKSTLLNAFLHDDRALVSDIHGTTRDVIEDTISIGGVLFRFIDTAGIRQSQDVIEAMGIERSFEQLDKAQIVVWVTEATNTPEQVVEFSRQILPHCNGKQIIAVINKTDIASPEIVKNAITPLLPDDAIVEAISARDTHDVERLQQSILQAAAMPHAQGRRTDR